MTRRRVGIIVAIGVVITLVALGIWRRQQLVDERTEARAARARAITALTAARVELERTVLRAGRIETDTLATRHAAELLQLLADGLAAQITTVTRERDDAVVAALVANGQVDALRVCLDGVNRALNQLSVGDPNAVGTLESVGASCRTVT